MNFKKMCFIIMAVICVLASTSCSTGKIKNAGDRLKNNIDLTSEEISSVKNGTNSNYPNIKYGDAFEAFFANPTWKYFKGTRDLPDDDGDGVADGKETNVDIVEFTGDCTYQDVKVKALLQFTLNDDNTFDATYLSFNEVPQSSLMIASLLEKAFSSYAEENTDSIVSATPSSETDSFVDSESSHGYNDIITDEYVRDALGVPTDAKNITVEYGEQYYKYACECFLVSVTIYENGESVAGADFNVDTGDIVCEIWMYSK